MHSTPTNICVESKVSTQICLKLYYKCDTKRTNMAVKLIARGPHYMYSYASYIDEHMREMQSF